MIILSPKKMIVFGFLLLVAGWILPFAMIIKLMEPTLLWNFFAYLASTIGLVLGLLGLVLHMGSQRRDQD